MGSNISRNKNTKGDVDIVTEETQSEFESTSESIGSEELRASSGSDVSLYDSDVSDDGVPLHKSVNEIKKNLEARGVNWRSPTYSDVEAAEDSDEFEFLGRNIQNPEDFYQRIYGKVVEMVEKSAKELEQEFESVKEMNEGVVRERAYQPTVQDLKKDKNTNGQRILNVYKIEKMNELKDDTIQLICDGPSGERVQDFWFECVHFRVGLIVIDCEWVEPRGILCQRYIPLDNKERLMCGDIIVARVTDVETRGHCRIQKVAIRHKDSKEELGWYPIWHCQRAPQDDPKLIEEFKKLKLELLEDVKSFTFLEHGPMPFCPSGAGRVFRETQPLVKDLDELFDVND